MLMVCRRVRLIARGPVPGMKGWRRADGRAKKAAGLSMADHWFGVIGPRHFDADASLRYKFRRRSAKYQRRKKELVRRGALPGPAVPLVYSGRSRSRVRLGRATGTSRKARLYIPTPALNFRPGGLDMRDELLSLTDADHRELNTAFRDGYVVSINGQRAAEIETVQ